MKQFKTLFVFSVISFSFISSYGQCSTCTITDPVVLPSPIPAGTVICITTNKTYDGTTDLFGGSAIHVCSGATLRLNGAVNLDATSEITTTGCSRVEIDGNVHNDNPIGLKVIDFCDCPDAIDPTGPIFGYGVVCGPLPVELVSFEGYLQNGNEALLSWSTATEINNSHFILDRSTDLINWETVMTVAGAGNSNQLKNYSTTDVLPEIGTYYYRLTQVDYDGKSETFPFVTVSCNSLGTSVSMTLFPNPASEYVMLSLNGNIEDDVHLEILNLSGQMISSSIIPKGSNRQQRVDLTGLGSGIYVIRVKGGSLSQSSKLIVG